MSAQDTSQLNGPDGDDLLAAEYVLGLLDGPDWLAARDRALVDQAFAARVQDWENRLAPLNAEFGEMPAPDLLAAIEARIFPPRPAARRFGFGWGIAAGLALVAGVFVAVALFVPQSPRQPAWQAELVDEAQTRAFQISYDRSVAELSVMATGPEPGEGQDYELWVIDESGVPRSLGLLTGAQTRLSAVLEPGQILAVSLEPAGGSPEPAPTGPVLAAAPLTDA